MTWTRSADGVSQVRWRKCGCSVMVTMESFTTRLATSVVSPPALLPTVGRGALALSPYSLGAATNRSVNTHAGWSSLPAPSPVPDTVSHLRIGTTLSTYPPLLLVPLAEGRFWGWMNDEGGTPGAHHCVWRPEATQEG